MQLCHSVCLLRKDKRQPSHQESTISFFRNRESESSPVLILGFWLVSRVLRGLNNSPSPATLSRARYRLDAFLMLLRQEQWRNWERDAAAARLAGQLASSAVICIGHSIAVGVLASACRVSLNLFVKFQLVCTALCMS